MPQSVGVLCGLDKMSPAQASQSACLVAPMHAGPGIRIRDVDNTDATIIISDSSRSCIGSQLEALNVMTFIIWYVTSDMSTVAT